MKTMTKPTVSYHSRGRSGNIFWILGAVAKALNKQRRITDYNECRDRVFCSGSYGEALSIISEYVELIDLDQM